ncbi:MFS general substrate transporter [Aspergillus welwitschiae]|uniref:MFS general substrate transporter n=1 Tax=Aspergillus welwitschiae TaxID=1341132 RepID=A0A3F3PKH5_9EURO|nr:MFS general substrate transporter [Aspergillus welwitschiae]RDH27439.1 MFS general substrate transporter [Aspergillus welwitschiae]
MAVPLDSDASSISPLSVDPIAVPNTAETEKQSVDEDSTPLPPPPPNGGIFAWVQVAGSFFLFFNSWGIINTFGVYQSYYETSLLRDYSPSSIAWIGTVQSFLLLSLGIIVGPIFDRGYIKFLIIAGTFLIVFGLMMTSLSKEYYQFFLAHGVAVGLGSSLLFIPSVAIPVTYFTSRRAVAMGIAASGGSVGAVVFPIVFHKLIDRVGFGWTTRVIAFIALASLLFSIAVMKSRLPLPTQARQLLDLMAFRDIPFLIYCLALFFDLVGLYFPYFYLPTYFTTYLHAGDNISFYVLSILSASSFFGRIAPNMLADRLGSLNVMILVSLVVTVLAFAWMGIHSNAGAIAFAVIYGFASGTVVALMPPVLALLCPDMAVVGTWMGMSFVFAGLGILIGNPIAGALLDLEHAVFWKGQLFAAVMVGAGMACFMALRLWKWKDGAGWKL